MSKLTDWLGQIQSQDPVDREALRERVIAALKEIYDPELPVNIYDLGLIYAVDVDDAAVVEVQMTLTTPGCPVAQTFPGAVENTVRAVEGVSAAQVELVWDPPWCADNLSMEVKLQLGLL
jgi:FeS assembly SUF system protein